MMHSRVRRRQQILLFAIFALFGLLLTGGPVGQPVAFRLKTSAASSLRQPLPMPVVVSNGNVKVIHDNNNIDGGAPTPSVDAKNLPQMETSVATNPVNRRIIAIAYNDGRFSYFIPGYWIGLSVSRDGGDPWFNTMVPGFFTDTSTAGQTSPIKGAIHSADPTVRFDASGNLYVSGLFLKYELVGGTQARRAGIFLARYNYTPGTSEGISNW